MYLIYLDESGNSGNNLNDPQQPVFLLCAMIIDENRWQALEDDLTDVIRQHFIAGIPEDFEVHGSDLRNGRGFFAGVSVGQRIAFRDAWLAVAPKHGVRLIYRAIQKKRYATWLTSTFGAGILVNPHVAAFGLVSKVVNDYLISLPGPPHGMFISDENREMTIDIEKSIRVLRAANMGSLHLSRIIEKGFFIDSRKSLPLQLCDVCALSLRKYEEEKAGLAEPKSIDADVFQTIEPLIYHGDERFMDVMAWLKEEQKKKRPGNKS